jgi:hypothetical protein
MTIVLVCQFRHSLLQPMWIPYEETLVKSDGLNPRMTLLAWVSAISGARCRDLSHS